MRILFLSRWFPYPPNNGSKLRIFNLLRGLASDHDVTLLSFSQEPVVEIPEPLSQLCNEVVAIPWKQFEPNSKQALTGFFKMKPRSVLYTFSAEMAQAIEKRVTQQSYDVVVATQIDMAVYHPYFHGVPAILEELEIATLYERFLNAQSLKSWLRAGLTWTKHRRYVDAVLAHFHACTVVSEQEQAILARTVPRYAGVRVVPNGVDLAGYNHIIHEPQPETLIFTGSFSYYPNYEAMTWFLGQVYPYVQRQLPDVHLTITGNHQDRALPTAQNVTRTGFVDDIAAYIARSWVSIVPIHTGGGTRLKILEAMALRTPVVATTKGAEGLDVEHGTHLLVADTPEEFANCVSRLHTEPALRAQIAENAYALVQRTYDWAVIHPQFLKLIHSIARKPTAAIPSV